MTTRPSPDAGLALAPSAPPSGGVSGSQHLHAVGHADSQVHAHAHRHAHAPVEPSLETRHSLLMAGALPRMAGALTVVTGLWLAVAWATGSVA